MDKVDRVVVEWDKLIHIEIVETVVEAEDCYNSILLFQESYRSLSNMGGRLSTPESIIPLYDEFFTAGTSSVNKSSSPADNSTQQDTQPTSNIQILQRTKTNLSNVIVDGNIDNQAEDAQFNKMIYQSFS
ncbi:hypothetical protein Tco_0771622 [Tanacetum coccineum]|uniref:Uncharacterized protein n=1 Tax=Tanacetum coccineum TaxID=301880 RepID=A0ABQ4ZGW5_9ASTR